MGVKIQRAYTTSPYCNDYQRTKDFFAVIFVTFLFTNKSAIRNNMSYSISVKSATDMVIDKFQWHKKQKHIKKDLNLRC